MLRTGHEAGYVIGGRRILSDSSNGESFAVEETTHGFPADSATGMQARAHLATATAPLGAPCVRHLGTSAFADGRAHVRLMRLLFLMMRDGV